MGGLRRSIEKGEGGRFWGEEVRECERERSKGERTKRGMRGASLALSIPLSAPRCREWDGALGSCTSAPLQQQQAPSAPRRISPPPHPVRRAPL